MNTSFTTTAIWGLLLASRSGRRARAIARAADRARSAAARSRRGSRRRVDPATPASSLQKLFWLPPLF